MRKKFKGYYRPKKAELKIIWQSCIFIFDTNVFLNLYRYSAKTREDLFNIFHKISERIWMPYQVGLEFHNNRLEVIHGQENAYLKLEDSINDFKGELAESLRSNRHPFIEKSEDYLKKIDGLLNEFVAKLKETREQTKGENKSDKILENITNLFDGKVGNDYKEEKKRDIYSNGKLRFENEIPPGYKDQKDKKGNKKYGDLVLWNQIIDKAKETKKPIIFITDDQKEDWWWESKGKTMGPRPELIQEINEKADCEFYMYKVEPFLKFAEESLNTKVDKRTYKEVKDVQRRVLEANEKAARVEEISKKYNFTKKLYEEILSKYKTSQNQLDTINHKYFNQETLQDYINLLTEQLNNKSKYDILNDINKSIDMKRYLAKELGVDEKKSGKDVSDRNSDDKKDKK